MALEELAEIEERYHFLTAQKAGSGECDHRYACGDQRDQATV
jgi:hypothetical protein